MATNVFPVDAVAGSPEYTGREARQVLSALVGGATAARPLGGRSGVRPGPTAVVSVSGGNWTVNPHNGVLDLQTAVEASCYLYATDAASTPDAIDAAHATYARKDIVYVTLDDPAESDGSSVPAATFGYDAGTASASPVAPTPPARSMVLAEINVPNVAGGGASSATVTAVWPYMAAVGGIITVRTPAERDLITFGTATNPVFVNVLSTGDLQRSVASGTWTTMAIVPTSGIWNLAGSLNVPTNTYTVMTATAVVETPTPGKFTNISGAIVVADAGVYEVDVAVRWPGTATAPLKRYIGLALNCASIDWATGALAAGTMIAAEMDAPTGTADFTQRFHSRRFTVAAGDQLRVFLAQDSGTTLVVNPGLNDALGYCMFGVHRVA